jgi:hypothetical protein
MSSSNVVSGVSASPSAAAGARHRHGAVKQLRIKVAQPQQQQLLLRGRRRQSGDRGSGVVARAGPGPLTEIEPDLREDPIDVYATPGISPVRPSSLLSIPLALKKEIDCLCSSDNTWVDNNLCVAGGF